MIRAIAFDWGGVFTRGTFDSGAVAVLASRYGETEASVAARYFPLMEAFEVGAFDLPTFQRRFEDGRTPGTGSASRSQPDASHPDAHRPDAPSAPPRRLSEADFRATFLGSVRWREPMFPLLASIPPRFRVAMLSNNVPVLCDLVRDDPRMARIERFVFSNEIAARKPDAAAFEALEGALGVAPEETVFVDDNEENIRACNALGFTGLLIDQPAAFVQRWRAALPDVPVPPGLAAAGGAW